MGVKLIQKTQQRNGGTLLADEQGLGKTVQVVSWLKLHTEAWPVLVVVPANAKYVWERHCKQWMDQSAHVVEGRGGDDKYLPLANIIIINYDILDSWVPYLNTVNFKCIVLDEIQNISNRETVRYQAVRDLCVREKRVGNKVVSRIPRIRYRIGVSGTPVENRPADLWPATTILWPWVFLSAWKYYWKFTRPFLMHRPHRWVFKGAKNIKLLRRKLLKLGMIRRLKKDVLPALSKRRKFKYVEIRHPEEYKKANDDFLQWLSGKSTEKARRAARAETLVKVGYLLRLAAKLKKRHTLRWIDRFHKKYPKKKLVVFSYMKFMLEKLEKRYGPGCVRIDGDVHGRQRMELVDRFQTYPGCWLAACNGRAAGVALTLTAAHTGLGIDFPWSPARMVQAEDRIHRYGQKHPTKFYYIVALDTAEEHVIDVLKEKQRDLSRIFDGKVDDDTRQMEKSMAAILVQRLRKRRR